MCSRNDSSESMSLGPPAEACAAEGPELASLARQVDGSVEGESALMLDFSWNAACSPGSGREAEQQLP